jgi:hypothetical protein
MWATPMACFLKGMLPTRAHKLLGPVVKKLNRALFLTICLENNDQRGLSLSPVKLPGQLFVKRIYYQRFSDNTSSFWPPQRDHVLAV